MRFWIAFCSDSRCEFWYWDFFLHRRNGKLFGNADIWEAWTLYHRLKFSVDRITVAVIGFFVFCGFIGIYVMPVPADCVTGRSFGVYFFEWRSAWGMIFTCIVDYGNIFLLCKGWRIRRNFVWIQSLSCGISFSPDFIEHIRVNFKIIVAFILLSIYTREGVVIVFVKIRGEKIVGIGNACLFCLHWFFIFFERLIVNKARC